MPKPQKIPGKYYVLRNRGKLSSFAIGDEVPAQSWPSAASMINLGWLQFIPNAPPPRASKPNPDLDATEDAGPSPVANEASKPGADLMAKPQAKTHGKVKTASTQ